MASAQYVTTSEPRAAAAARASHLPLGALPAYGAALLSGTLYFLAFPGMEIWPLSFVALIPLIVALRGQTARRGFGVGWTAGFAMTMLGFYWLVDMLQTFSGFPLPLCVLFMAILCAYQSCRIGFLGWLACRAEQRGWPPGVAFVLGFTTSELVFPLLFPWFYAATVHQVPWLLQTADLGGPIAVALGLVATNLALAEPLIAWLKGRSPRYKVALALLIVPLSSLGYAAVRIRSVDEAVEKAETARVGLVQANMSLLGKRHDPEEALKRHLSLSRGLSQEKPLDLLVWSETSVGGAVDERYANQNYKGRVGIKLDSPAIFGAVLSRQVNDARRYTLSNSALVTDAHGNVQGRYDKQYLLAFGEYLPFGETFPVLYEWSPNSGHFTPGKSFDPLPVGKRTVATFICYEDILPAFVNRMMKHGEPALLVNLTNDAWFGDTTEPWIHLALSKLRAVEHRRFFVRSTNSGVSAFIDPVGRTLATTPTFSEIAIAKDLKWLELETPYQLWGDAPWWVLAMVSFGLALVRRRPPLPKAPTKPGAKKQAPGKKRPEEPEPSAARPEGRPAPAAEPESSAEESTGQGPSGGTPAQAPGSASPPEPQQPAKAGAAEEPEIVGEAGEAPGSPSEPQKQADGEAGPAGSPEKPAEVGKTPKRDSSEFGHFPKPPTKSEP